MEGVEETYKKEVGQEAELTCRRVGLRLRDLVTVKCSAHYATLLSEGSTQHLLQMSWVKQRKGEFIVGQANTNWLMQIPSWQKRGEWYENLSHCFICGQESQQKGNESFWVFQSNSLLPAEYENHMFKGHLDTQLHSFASVEAYLYFL